MIKLIIGGIGSGKSVSAIKEIITRDLPCFTNFGLKYKNHVRLEVSHIIQTIKEEKKKKQSVNWEFWKKRMAKGLNFDIYIDEAHNVINSRRAMTKFNTLFSLWLSQIRKILGGNTEHHLYMLSQRITGIDVIARELASQIIYVQKHQTSNLLKTKVRENGRLKEKKIPETYIIKYFFNGTYCLDKFESFQMGGKTHDFKSVFLANPFFKYYDSFEIIDFGNDIYV